MVIDTIAKKAVGVLAQCLTPHMLHVDAELLKFWKVQIAQTQFSGAATSARGGRAVVQTPHLKYNILIRPHDNASHV